ncbi:MAG: hypothetical protein IJE97_03440 [Thermoguttaceae bacterium]|nr:hypothetical protein [Thermoguttaceae bacterium]
MSENPKNFFDFSTLPKLGKADLANSPQLGKPARLGAKERLRRPLPLAFTSKSDKRESFERKSENFSIFFNFPQLGKADLANSPETSRKPTWPTPPKLRESRLFNFPQLGKPARLGARATSPPPSSAARLYK